MDPPSPSSPSPFPDLNLLPIVAKLEPKLEPPDLPNPSPNASLLHNPELLTPLQQLPPDEDSLFSEYLRLAHLFRASFPSGGDATLVPAAGGDAPSSAIVVAAKKRKGRSSEMVRVSAITPRDGVYFRDLVRRTRITFDSLRSLLIHEESKAEALGLLLTKRGRPDLKAAALMTDRDLWMNRDKRIIGSIPGTAIGDVFFFRMELCVIGLHGQVQAGIDYVPAGRAAGGEPIATSIIVSGGYEDDDDSGDVIVYTGHGGRDRLLGKHCVDQKLEGGNLALERSMVYGIEIRVIRGVKCDRSPTSKVYVYDGLYKVVKCWMDVGKSGFGVYKYKLVRVEGQEEMGTGILKLAEDLKLNALSVRPRGYLSLDMSMGRENLPVSVFNGIDDDRDPLFFEYLARPAYLSSVIQEKVFADGACGCDCLVTCSNKCNCAMLNGGEFAFDENGFLLRGKPLIYECGPSCRCPPSCPNRVSQKGLRSRLEVFRSRETGWGVRSLDLIRAGSFVCEFSGIVLTKQQSEVASMNGDSLVYPNRFPGRWVEWGDISDVFADYVPPCYPSLPELNFSVDVSKTRNVACYLSHSCTPNVFVQFVLYDHYNVSYPHLMIFAMENIPPLRELSIDYGVADEWVAKLTF